MLWLLLLLMGAICSVCVRPSDLLTVSTDWDASVSCIYTFCLNLLRLPKGFSTSLLLHCCSAFILRGLQEKC